MPDAKGNFCGISVPRAIPSRSEQRRHERSPGRVPKQRRTGAYAEQSTSAIDIGQDRTIYSGHGKAKHLDPDTLARLRKAGEDAMARCQDTAEALREDRG